MGDDGDGDFTDVMCGGVASRRPETALITATSRRRGAGVLNSVNVATVAVLGLLAVGISADEGGLVGDGEKDDWYDASWTLANLSNVYAGAYEKYVDSPRLLQLVRWLVGWLVRSFVCLIN